MEDERKKFEREQKWTIAKKNEQESQIKKLEISVRKKDQEKVSMVKQMKQQIITENQFRIKVRREKDNLISKEKSAQDRIMRLERRQKMTQELLKKQTQESQKSQSKLLSLIRKSKSSSSPSKEKFERLSPSLSSPTLKSSSTPSKKSFASRTRAFRFRLSSSHSSTVASTLSEKESNDGSEKKNHIVKDNQIEKGEPLVILKKKFLDQEIEQCVIGQEANLIVDNLLTKRDNLIEDRIHLLNKQESQNKFHLESIKISTKSNDIMDEKDGNILQREILSSQKVSEEHRLTQEQLETLDSELAYINSRIKNIQNEAISLDYIQTMSKEMKDEINLSSSFSDVGGAASQFNARMDNVLAIVQSLDLETGKCIIERFVEDIVSLQLQDRQKTRRIQELEKEKNQHKKIIQILKRQSQQQIPHGVDWMNSLNQDLKYLRSQNKVQPIDKSHERIKKSDSHGRHLKWSNSITMEFKDLVDLERQIEMTPLPNLSSNLPNNNSNEKYSNKKEHHSNDGSKLSLSETEEDLKDKKNSPLLVETDLHDSTTLFSPSQEESPHLLEISNFVESPTHPSKDVFQRLAASHTQSSQAKVINKHGLESLQSSTPNSFSSLIPTLTPPSPLTSSQPIFNHTSSPVSMSSIPLHQDKNMIPLNPRQKDFAGSAIEKSFKN